MPRGLQSVENDIDAGGVEGAVDPAFALCAVGGMDALVEGFVN